MMAKTGRKRKPNVPRQPNGEPRRNIEHHTSPATLRRVRDQALRHAVDPRLGTIVGQWNMRREITDEQFSAATKFSQLRNAWDRINGMPRRTAAPVDVDGTPRGDGAGPAEHEGDERVVEAYESARRHLTIWELSAIEHIVGDNEAPLGHEQRLYCIAGLSRLVAFWGIRG